MDELLGVRYGRLAAYRSARDVATTVGWGQTFQLDCNPTLLTSDAHHPRVRCAYPACLRILRTTSQAHHSATLSKAV